MKEPGTEGDDKGAQEEDMYTYAMANISEDDQLFFQAQAMIQNGGKTQQQLAKESYYYNRMSEEMDRAMNAVTRVEDVERENYIYDYDKAKEESMIDPFLLDEFDDLNDW